MYKYLFLTPWMSVGWLGYLKYDTSESLRGEIDF